MGSSVNDKWPSSWDDVQQMVIERFVDESVLCVFLKTVWALAQQNKNLVGMGSQASHPMPRGEVKPLQSCPLLSCRSSYNQRLLLIKKVKSTRPRARANKRTL